MTVSARFAGIAVLIGIASLALLPQPWKGRMATHGVIHDYAHAGAFLIACLLTTWQIARTRMAVLTAFLLLAFGVLLEYMQTRVYGNRLEYGDIVADALGLALALIIRTVREI